MSEALPVREILAKDDIAPPDEVASNEQADDLVLVQRAQLGDYDLAATHVAESNLPCHEPFPGILK